MYAQEPNVKRQSTLFVSYMLTIPRRIIIVFPTIYCASEHTERMHDAQLASTIVTSTWEAILVFLEKHISGR